MAFSFWLSAGMAPPLGSGKLENFFHRPGKYNNLKLDELAKVEFP
jgi:hypothetical protein